MIIPMCYLVNLADMHILFVCILCCTLYCYEMHLLLFMNMYKKGLLILLVFIYLSCCIRLFSKYLNIMLYTDLIQTMPAQGFTPQAISKLHYYKSATVHRAAVCNKYCYKDQIYIVVLLIMFQIIHKIFRRFHPE